MKRYIVADSEDIFCMSKITRKYAIPEIAGLIDDFVYFSPSNSSHGPRIKFYGGTRDTSTTRNAPALAFDTYGGNFTIELESWMNKKNCPNAFDAKYIDKIERFVTNYLPILLLVWFNHLDEADALAYFHGNIDIAQLFASIEYEIPEDVADFATLDQYCREHNLYRF